MMSPSPGHVVRTPVPLVVKEQNMIPNFIGDLVSAVNSLIGKLFVS
ncbi:hypothetical protein ACWIGI_06685 [Nocardia sp. NPDC055321]